MSRSDSVRIGSGIVCARRYAVPIAFASSATVARRLVSPDGERKPEREEQTHEAEQRGLQRRRCFLEMIGTPRAHPPTGDDTNQGATADDHAQHEYEGDGAQPEQHDGPISLRRSELPGR
jgi:hypothetical protein